MSEQGVRLAKRMVELGLCSRREADEYIEQGAVRVDGAVVCILGSRVTPQQKIELTRPALPLSDERVTMLLYKPANETTPLQKLIRPETRFADDYSDTVFSPRHCRQLALFGTLDPSMSGMVVLTQDGRLANKLAECEMEYLIAVEAAPPADALQHRSQNMTLHGRALAPFKVSRQSDHQLRFVLHAPQPEQIQQMCVQLGVSALSVRCIRIGRIALGKLGLGQWRYLLPTERF